MINFEFKDKKYSFEESELRYWMDINAKGSPDFTKTIWREAALDMLANSDVFNEKELSLLEQMSPIQIAKLFSIEMEEP